jgi:hypothetical protein
MFCSSMEHEIYCEVCGPNVRYVGTMLSNYCTHINSSIAFANALYSTSMLDLDTLGCFLVLHEIKFLPRYTAKSESEKVLNNTELDFMNFSPMPSVYFKYLRIHFTIVKCMCDIPPLSNDG